MPIVYDVTKYVKNHPGGVDVLVDVAGKDATEAYEDVGHSEDANDILEAYLIGTLKDAADYKARTAVKVIQEPVMQQPRKGSSRWRGFQRTSLVTFSLTVVSSMGLSQLLASAQCWVVH